MSSALSSWSQVGVRERLFIGLMDASSNGAAFVTDVSCIGFNQPASPDIPLVGGQTYVNTSTDLSSGNIDINGLTVSRGGLYRDMAQEIIVTDTDGVYLSRFRLGNTVSGPTTEGVRGAGAQNVWLKTWSASGGGVAVARTG